MPSVTIMRLDAVQRCPAWKKCAIDGNGNGGREICIVQHNERVLSPISNCTRAPLRTAAAATPGPTSREPVKLTASINGDDASAAPSLAPGPITMLSTPVGSPARCTISASAQGEAGTSSAGLNTTQFPYASAGAIFQAGMASGKFHGVMAATTPTGSRVISTSMPGRTESPFSPARRTASPAKNLRCSPHVPLHQFHRPAVFPVRATTSGRVHPSVPAFRFPRDQECQNVPAAWNATTT